MRHALRGIGRGVSVGVVVVAASCGGSRATQEPSGALAAGPTRSGSAALGTRCAFPPLAFSDVGLDPRAVRARDINGDGFVDLVVANRQTDDVTVLIRNGVGRFNPRVEYPAGSSPEDVVLHDFDGDGHADAVTANATGNDVSVLLGSSTGTFAAPVHYATGAGPTAVVAGDFNGDGKGDLGVAESGANSLGVLLGNGDGTFAAVVEYPVGLAPAALALSDLDADGDLDVLVANSKEHDVGVLLGNGDGTFAAQVTYPAGPSPKSIAVSHLNLDHHPDVVVAGADGQVRVLLGKTGAALRAPVAYPAGTQLTSVALADVNADGHIDVVATDAADRFFTLLGDGAGALSAAVLSHVGVGPSAVAIADLSGDGFLDVAVANSGEATVATLIGDNRGGFERPIEGLEAYFPLDGALEDRSGAGAVVVPTGTTFVTGGPLGAQAMEFDGATSVARISPPKNFGFKNNRSMCGWVNVASTASATGLAMPIFAGGSSAGATDFLSVLPSNPHETGSCGNVPGGMFLDHWGTPCVPNPPVQVVPFDAWSQVCFVESVGVLTLEMNAATYTANKTLFSWSESTITIGSNTVGGTTTASTFLGAIKEVSLWSVVIGPGEFATLYNGGAGCRVR